MVYKVSILEILIKKMWIQPRLEFFFKLKVYSLFLEQKIFSLLDRLREYKPNVCNLNVISDTASLIYLMIACAAAKTFQMPMR